MNQMNQMIFRLSDKTHVSDLMIATSHGTSETISTCAGEWRIQLAYDHQDHLTEIGLYLDEYVGDIEAREFHLPNPLYLDSRWLTMSSDEHWWPAQEAWVNERIAAVDASDEQWVLHPDGFTLKMDSMCVWDVFVTTIDSGQARSIRLARRT